MSPFPLLRRLAFAHTYIAFRNVDERGSLAEAIVNRRGRWIRRRESVAPTRSHPQHPRRRVMVPNPLRTKPEF